MKVSLNWLKHYVDIPADFDPKELALKLTMSTVEVEEVIDSGEKLSDLYVGHIIKITKHPDADKLWVAEIDIKSEETVQVVFGSMAQVKEGDLVPIVLAPSTLPTGIKVEKQKIRGVLSQGMICLDSEFMVGGEEILTYFPPDTKVGSLVKEVMDLDDVIYEIENKSLTNRPDLWGHYGIAREIAAILGLKLKPVEVANVKEEGKTEFKVKVQDPVNCPRYMGVMIGGITIEPSPFWLQNLLKTIGVRPINNVVDLTNYVMMELGQPLHAFDRRQITKDTIIVKTLSNQKFTTLDDQIRELSDNALMINDQTKPVAIAGIMGGQNSEVVDDTTEIIVEFANFNPVNIRKTSQALGLRTEGAVRHEKSLDPLLTELALKRFITLIKEIIPSSKVISKAVDVVNFKEKEIIINLDLDFVERRIGQKIAKKEIIKILESLEFTVKEQASQLKVKVPSFRATRDISLPEDLIEEIARIYGYDYIEGKMPMVSMAHPEFNLERFIERKIKNILVNNCGLTEVYNYSFTDTGYILPLGLKTEDHWQLKNYFSSEQRYLRSSLLSNLLKNLTDNLRFFKEFDLFELGRVFTKETGEFKINNQEDTFLAQQEKHLAGLSVGEDAFYKIKGIVETLLGQLEVVYEFRQIEKSDKKFINPLSCLEIIVNEQTIGYLTELASETINEFSDGKPVGYWQISFNQLLKFSQDNKKYQPLPKFPGIIYDLSIIVPLNTYWADIRQEVLETSSLVQKVQLFDIYKIEKLGPDKKSLAFHIYFSDSKRTLTAEETSKLRDKIVKQLTKKFKAEVR
ncbi:phenylalanine--tRNA ligase subunit beta [Patescibacteria group bacterium]|nr:phenylalanine--tRNA ligase subunit beta [Patescibacteria group bacterium]